jgi:hypothetical protein
MLDEPTGTSTDFLPMYAGLCKAAAPYMAFLREALGVAF